MIKDNIKKLEELYSSFLDLKSGDNSKGFGKIFKNWLNYSAANEKEQDFLDEMVKIIDDIYEALEKEDIDMQKINAKNALDILFRDNANPEYEGYIKFIQNKGATLFKFAERQYLKELYEKINKKRFKMLPIELKTIELLKKSIL